MLTRNSNNSCGNETVVMKKIILHIEIVLFESTHVLWYLRLFKA